MVVIQYSPPVPRGRLGLTIHIVWDINRWINRLPSVPNLDINRIPSEFRDGLVLGAATWLHDFSDCSNAVTVLDVPGPFPGGLPTPTGSLAFMESQDPATCGVQARDPVTFNLDVSQFLNTTGVLDPQVLPQVSSLEDLRRGRIVDGAPPHDTRVEGADTRDEQATTHPGGVASLQLQVEQSIRMIILCDWARVYFVQGR